MSRCQNHFPENLADYDLVIHCGSCMLNRREVLNRILHCRTAGVPITNYGLCIAWSLGVFERALARDARDRRERAHRRGLQARFSGLTRREREVLGCDHGEAGSWLMAHWGLPERLTLSARAVHDPAAVTVPRRWRRCGGARSGPPRPRPGAPGRSRMRPRRKSLDGLRHRPASFHANQHNTTTVNTFSITATAPSPRCS